MLSSSSALTHRGVCLVILLHSVQLHADFLAELPPRASTFDARSVQAPLTWNYAYEQPAFNGLYGQPIPQVQYRTGLGRNGNQDYNPSLLVDRASELHRSDSTGGLVGSAGTLELAQQVAYEQPAFTGLYRQPIPQVQYQTGLARNDNQDYTPSLLVDRASELHGVDSTGGLVGSAAPLELAQQAAWQDLQQPYVDLHAPLAHTGSMASHSEQRQGLPSNIESRLLGHSTASSYFDSPANKNLRQLIRESFLQTQDRSSDLRSRSDSLGEVTHTELMKQGAADDGRESAYAARSFGTSPDNRNIPFQHGPAETQADWAQRGGVSLFQQLDAQRDFDGHGAYSAQRDFDAYGAYRDPALLNRGLSSVYSPSALAENALESRLARIQNPTTQDARLLQQQASFAPSLPTAQTNRFLSPVSKIEQAFFVRVDAAFCTPACVVGHGVCVLQRSEDGIFASCVCTTPYAGSTCANVHDSADHLSLLSLGNAAAPAPSKVSIPLQSPMLRLTLLFVMATVLTVSAATAVLMFCGVSFAGRSAASQDPQKRAALLRPAEEISSIRVQQAPISGARLKSNHAALGQSVSCDRGAHLSGCVVESWVKRPPSFAGVPTSHRPEFSNIPQVVQDDPED